MCVYVQTYHGDGKATMRPNPWYGTQSLNTSDRSEKSPRYHDANGPARRLSFSRLQAPPLFGAETHYQCCSREARANIVDQSQMEKSCLIWNINYKLAVYKVQEIYFSVKCT